MSKPDRTVEIHQPDTKPNVGVPHIKYEMVTTPPRKFPWLFTILMYIFFAVVIWFNASWEEFFWAIGVMTSSVFLLWIIWKSG